MKYSIVTARNPRDLEERVALYIDRGYIPQGGVIFAQSSLDKYDQSWAQAMFSGRFENDKGKTK